MAACNCVNSTISTCGNITAGVECFENILQGEDREICVQIMDADSIALDISIYSSIQLFLFDINDEQVAAYTNPLISDSDSLIIKQTENTDTGDSTTDTGKICFNIPSSLSCELLSGNLTVELRLEEPDTNFADGTKTTIISCLFIGEIIFSKIII